ncbi:MAG: hypothetical protein AB4372_19705, partial [Xenococcus sp. (in: cyanobacteria)]
MAIIWLIKPPKSIAKPTLGYRFLPISFFDPQRDLAALSAFNSEGGQGGNLATTSVNTTSSLDSHLSSEKVTNSKFSHLSLVDTTTIK